MPNRLLVAIAVPLIQAAATVGHCAAIALQGTASKPSGHTFVHRSRKSPDHLEIQSSPRCAGYLDSLAALQQLSSGACSPALQQLRALLLRVDRRVLAPHRRLERHPRDSAPRAPCRPPAYSLLLQRFQTRPTARPITVEHANPSPKWVPSLAAQNTGLHNHTNPAKGEAACSPRSARICN